MGFVHTLRKKIHTLPSYCSTGLTLQLSHVRSKIKSYHMTADESALGLFTVENNGCQSLHTTLSSVLTRDESVGET